MSQNSLRWWFNPPTGPKLWLANFHILILKTQVSKIISNAFYFILFFAKVFGSLKFRFIIEFAHPFRVFFCPCPARTPSNSLSASVNLYFYSHKPPAVTDAAPNGPSAEQFTILHCQLPFFLTPLYLYLSHFTTNVVRSRSIGVTYFLKSEHDWEYAAGFKKSHSSARGTNRLQNRCAQNSCRLQN